MKRSACICSGKCGDNVKYRITEEAGGLAAVIHGRGPMTDFINEAASPFYEYRKKITSVTVGNGVTGIGNNAFWGCEALKDVSIAGSVRYLGFYAFFSCSSLEELTLPEGLEIIGPKSLEKCAALKKLTLPSTLTNIDFKATLGDDAITNVSYNGSRTQWERCVRVSPACLGNKCVTSAEFEFTAESSLYSRKLAELAAVIKKGGDGKMHIIAPDLTALGTKHKSGDLTFIIFPDGRTMMIDAGVNVSEARVLSLVRGLDISRLDWFVLSHPHIDHYGSAVAAMNVILKEKSGSVGCYISSGYNPGKEEVERLKELLRASGTEINCSIRAGDCIDVGDVHIEVFNPDEEVLHEEKGSTDGLVNNTSVSFKFTFGRSTYLTCGDLYAGRERVLAARYGDRLRADVMKTDHHGVFTSNTPEWFAAVRPKYVISEDDGADWTRFDERLKKEGITNYKVSDCGLTVVTLNGTRRYKIETEYPLVSR